MTTVRIVITLKPGVLDAQGQAVRQGLHSLGYHGVSEVRVGKYLELTIPDGMAVDQIDEMCSRFLANPLIEEWRVVHLNAMGDSTLLEARSAKPEARR